MKHIRPNKLFPYILAASLLIFCSCSKNGGNDEGAGEPATIVLLAGQTRAGANAFEEQEYDMESLRLLIFEHNSGKIYKNIYYSSLPTDQVTEIKIEILTGYYDFVFVGNEQSDPRMAGILSGMQVSNDSNISQIRDEYFVSTAITGSIRIPMIATYRAFITDDDTLQAYDADGRFLESVSGNWHVSLQRAAVKVNLTLVTYNETYRDEFKSIRIANVPDRVYLFRHNTDGNIYDNTGTVETVANTSSTFIDTYRTFAKAEGDAYDASAKAGHRIVPLETDADWTATTDGNGSTRYVWYKRLILPAAEFTPGTEKTKAIKLQSNLETPGGEAYSRTGSIGSTAYGYSLLRNNIYELTGAITETITIEGISVQEWIYEPISIE